MDLGGRSSQQAQGSAPLSLCILRFFFEPAYSKQAVEVMEAVLPEPVIAFTKKDRTRSAKKKHCSENRCTIQRGSLPDEQVESRHQGAVGPAYSKQSSLERTGLASCCCCHRTRHHSPKKGPDVHVILHYNYQRRYNDNDNNEPSERMASTWQNVAKSAKNKP